MRATMQCTIPGFEQVDAWIFDLDNTLYPPKADLFGQINRLMTEFIMLELSVEEGEANRLRRTYWSEYGTTLAGLMARHGVDADEFLHKTHQLDLSPLHPAPDLRASISALPGRLLIHTNGPRAHADRVLSARGLEGVFEQIVALEDKGLVSKPRTGAYDAFARLTGVDPARAVMIEDHVDNLAEPYRRGTKTVWLDHGETRPTPRHVDIRATDLEEFFDAL